MFLALKYLKFSVGTKSSWKVDKINQKYLYIDLSLVKIKYELLYR